MWSCSSAISAFPSSSSGVGGGRLNYSARVMFTHMACSGSSRSLSSNFSRSLISWISLKALATSLIHSNRFSFSASAFLLALSAMGASFSVDYFRRNASYAFSIDQSDSLSLLFSSQPLLYVEEDYFGP
uniref:Uncharacterized protein n=1 Tax=Leersia perrieri TaxID=77586 RepID=A0A0D9WS17_9ORYZ